MSSSMCFDKSIAHLTPKHIINCDKKLLIYVCLVVHVCFLGNADVHLVTVDVGLQAMTSTFDYTFYDPELRAFRLPEPHELADKKVCLKFHF